MPAPKTTQKPSPKGGAAARGGKTPAGGKNGKPAAKSGGRAGKTQDKPAARAAQTGHKAPPPPPRKTQRRELWLLSCFLLTVVLSLAVFGVEGSVTNALRSLARGLLGAGSYLLPVSAFLACLVILFARGEPVALRLWAAASLPVLVGMTGHILFCKVTYTWKSCLLLYEDGIHMTAGGFLAGGLAALFSSALSNAGALIVVLLVGVAMVLAVLRVRLEDIVGYILELRESARLREEEEYTDEPVLPRANARREPVGVAVYGDEEPMDEPPAQKPPREAPPSRRRAPDMPLEPVAPIQPNRTPPKDRLSGDRLTELQNTPVPLPPLPAEPFPANPPAPPPRESDFEPPEDDLPPFDLEDFPEYVREPDELDEPEDGEELPGMVTLPSEPLPPYPGEPVVVDTHMLHAQEKAQAPQPPAPMPQNDAAAQYVFPPLSLLREDDQVPTDDATEELRMRSQKLTDTLSSFGVEARIINVIRGPSVTRYEMQLDRGVKYSRITNLQDDIALALGASGVRIAAIPDKFAVGIEVPNKVVQFVYLRDVLTSSPMSAQRSKIAFALGRDITGECVTADIVRMPHLLIAGTTGSGKSVCINSIIISLLYRASPKEVRMVMIDPKMVELGNYNGIPHLLIPVVTDYKKAAGALNWAVGEMERRYKLLSERGARDLTAYNRSMETAGEEPLPQIVIIIDELADLMAAAGKEIEESICRIAQKARAAGMHLIIATQRPSADVLTGLMKSNIPSRIAFAVQSQIESRIILDTGGADKLIGRGDMLFLPMGLGKPRRVQGCFLSDGEIESICEFIKQNGQADYSESIMEHIERQAADESGGDTGDDDDADVMLGDAIDVVMDTGQASASMLQRRLKLGYARAARIIDQMENRGIIGPFDGSRPRQILISRTDWQEMKMRYGVRS